MCNNKVCVLEISLYVIVFIKNQNDYEKKRRLLRWGNSYIIHIGKIGVSDNDSDLR